MPFCNEHNEVYRAEVCPKCAGEPDDDAAPTKESTDDVNDLVSDAIESATEGLESSEIGGDAVVGSQEKSIERTDVTDIDQSTTQIDESTDVTDDSTVVEDSVVQSSDIGDSNGGTELRDSVVKDSDIGGSESRHREQDDQNVHEKREPLNTSPAQEIPTQSGRTSPDDEKETKFCLYCGVEIPEHAMQCPECGKNLQK